MTFTKAILERVSRASVDEQTNNRDFDRHGIPSIKSRIYSIARKMAKTIGFGPYRWVNQVRPVQLENWNETFSEIEWLYDRIDDESRELLVDVIAYRLMGDRAIRLAVNTPEYWAKLKGLKDLQTASDPIKFGFLNWELNQFDLRAIGFPFKLYSRANSLMAQFILEQYACDRLGVRAENGFVVIDGGGCYGDTALYFAHLVGTKGRVFSFEFVESNLRLYRKNLDENPELASRIHICENPLWSTSDNELFVQDRGPASTVSSIKPTNGDATIVETLSIDDLVSRKALTRIDFIKMDIEGAEFEALKGAENTIRKFKPQLAVCVYHSPQDFVRLAKLIHQYAPGYEFALGHFTIHQEETILFAKHGGRDTAKA